jgi:hypothetical protein
VPSARVPTSLVENHTRRRCCGSEAAAATFIWSWHLKPTEAHHRPWQRRGPGQEDPESGRIRASPRDLRQTVALHDPPSLEASTTKQTTPRTRSTETLSPTAVVNAAPLTSQTRCQPPASRSFRRRVVTVLAPPQPCHRSIYSTWSLPGLPNTRQAHFTNEPNRLFSLAVTARRVYTGTAWRPPNPLQGLMVCPP